MNATRNTSAVRARLLCAASLLAVVLAGTPTSAPAQSSATSQKNIGGSSALSGSDRETTKLREGAKVRGSRSERIDRDAETRGRAVDRELNRGRSGSTTNPEFGGGGTSEPAGTPRTKTNPRPKPKPETNTASGTLSPRDPASADPVPGRKRRDVVLDGPALRRDAGRAPGAKSDQVDRPGTGPGTDRAVDRAGIVRPRGVQTNPEFGPPAPKPTPVERAGAATQGTNTAAGTLPDGVTQRAAVPPSQTPAQRSVGEATQGRNNAAGTLSNTRTNRPATSKKKLGITPAQQKIEERGS